jgi:hypothetical protein
MSLAAERTGLRSSCLEAFDNANAETPKAAQNPAIVCLRGGYVTGRIAGTALQTTLVKPFQDQ